MSSDLTVCIAEIPYVPASLIVSTSTFFLAYLPDTQKLSFFYLLLYFYVVFYLL